MNRGTIMRHGLRDLTHRFPQLAQHLVRQRLFRIRFERLLQMRPASANRFSLAKVSP